MSEAIDAIVHEQPVGGIRTVGAALRRHSLQLGPRRVHARMRASGIVRPRDSEGPRGPAPRGQVTTPEPNRRIAVEVTTVWTAEDGKLAVAIGVDRGCRGVLDVTVTRSRSSGAILASADRARQAACGSPAEVADGVELRSDHGPRYAGYRAEALVKAWGVTHTFAPVGRPTGNAGAKRTIHTMKGECTWLRDGRNLAELREARQAWARTFNHDRPHQALAWQTPAERRKKHLGPHQRKAAGERCSLATCRWTPVPEPPLGAEASPAGPLAARSAGGGMGGPLRTGRLLRDATGLYNRFSTRLVS